MAFNGFFRIVWSLQILVGVALFAVSFLIEGHILASFFGIALVAWVLAAALEIGKAASIVWHRHLLQSQPEEYPLATRLTSGAFRVGLVGLSVLCSLLFLGAQLDRPHAAELRDAGLAAVDTRLAEDLTRIDADRDARSASLASRQAAELAEAQGEHQRRVRDLEARLAREMDNVVGGTFKGPRYKELEAQLVAARGERERVLGELAARHAQDGPRLAAALAQEHRAARAERTARAEAERRAVAQADFDDDPRAHDPRVVAFLRMVQSMAGIDLSAPQFVFGFAFALAVLTELGILLAFDTVTVAARQVLAAQQREQVLSEELIAQMAGDAEREALRHREAMDRVRRGAERIAERAGAEAAAINDGAPPRDYPRAA